MFTRGLRRPGPGSIEKPPVALTIRRLDSLQNQNRINGFPV
jgi:hypothetical protein